MRGETFVKAILWPGLGCGDQARQGQSTGACGSAINPHQPEGTGEHNGQREKATILLRCLRRTFAGALTGRRTPRRAGLCQRR